MTQHKMIALTTIKLNGMRHSVDLNNICKCVKSKRLMTDNRRIDAIAIFQMQI